MDKTNDNGGKTYTITEGFRGRDVFYAFVAGLIAGMVLALSIASFIRYSALCVR